MRIKCIANSGKNLSEKNLAQDALLKGVGPQWNDYKMDA
jgi:hypothetical protein